MVVKFLGHTLTQEQLQKVAKEADEDGGGTLDFEEFLSMAARLEATRPSLRLGKSDGGSSTDLSSSGSSSGARGRLTPKERHRAVFMKCKTSEDVIEVKDLSTALKLAGHCLSEAEVHAIAEEADDDGSGTLDEREFAALVENLDRKVARQAEVRQIFSRCKAGDSIELAGLGAALRLAGHTLSTAEVNALALEADDDGSGTIDVDEFLAMVDRLDTSQARNS
jgi:Ca2+-binding EF-hand superfamily protein